MVCACSVLPEKNSTYKSGWGCTVTFLLLVFFVSLAFSLSLALSGHQLHLSTTTMKAASPRKLSWKRSQLTQGGQDQAYGNRNFLESSGGGKGLRRLKALQPDFGCMD